jgi:hypothetical protein
MNELEELLTRLSARTYIRYHRRCDKYGREHILAKEALDLMQACRAALVLVMDRKPRHLRIIAAALRRLQ